MGEQQPRMDIMQIFGDYIQLLGMIILATKLCLTKNCAGVSGKTQFLYAVIFTARYADLTVRYVSLYNTLLKIIYTSVSYCTVLSIFLFFRKTYDHKHDGFRIDLLILPCAIFALFINHRFEALEVLWSFSVYLEAVAIVPQVYFVSKSKRVESTIVSYVACLGLYRGCYLMHWLYAYFKRGTELERIAISSGIVQLVLYCDFFARNLPILKSKDSYREARIDDDDDDKKIVVDLPRGKDGGEEGEEGNARTLNCKGAQKTEAAAVVVAMPEGALTAEEKVTLLASREPGTSN